MPINAPVHLLKRVRRHVTGPIHDLFAVVSPGLEDICARELRAAPLMASDVLPSDGGVAFRGRLSDLMRANLHLRSASRIIMRLTRFHAANFRQLARKALAFPWELYLPPDIAPLVQVASHHSRLYHRRAVAEHLTAAIAERCDPSGRSWPQSHLPAERPRVMVRIEADRFTLSLDSSGSLLHKRGIKSHPGRAPLRETLAAAILEMAGYDPRQPLLDPMSGSGTFTVEAVMKARNIAPGLQRDFAFSHWPAFSPAAWEHLRREAEMRMAPLPTTPRIMASDRDEEACKRLRECLQQNGLDQSARVLVADFFTLDPATLFDGPGLVVINPPYGRRLGNPVGSRQGLTAILNHLTVAYRNWRFALLLPASAIDLLPVATQTFSLFHGGLPLVLFCGTVR